MLRLAFASRFLTALAVLSSMLLLTPARARAAEDKLFDYREITLDNGLKVITLEDFSAPIVAVHLWYHVGSKNEDPQRQGFAHMFEHMMFRGTDRLGPTDHFDFIRRTGGNVSEPGRETTAAPHRQQRLTAPINSSPQLAQVTFIGAAKRSGVRDSGYAGVSHHLAYFVK